MENSSEIKISYRPKVANCKTTFERESKSFIIIKLFVVKSKIIKKREREKICKLSISAWLLCEVKSSYFLNSNSRYLG